MVRRIKRLYEEHLVAWLSVTFTFVSRAWSPPISGCWKVNFDIAIRTTCLMAVVICRDHFGHFLFAWTKSFPPGTLFVGEARVALLVVQEAFFPDHSCLIFEGDNLVVCSSL